MTVFLFHSSVQIQYFIIHKKYAEGNLSRDRQTKTEWENKEADRKSY